MTLISHCAFVDFVSNESGRIPPGRDLDLGKSNDHHISKGFESVLKSEMNGLHVTILQVLSIRQAFVMRIGRIPRRWGYGGLGINGNTTTSQIHFNRIQNRSRGRTYGGYHKSGET